ncbi:MAG: (2Fe-2S) ferredoxin domain-containing protein [Desulfobacteraceae bacterium]|nr:MAG: (2Fe-2S) ferredoxin domain-containing protein [Desulfobacteraceae bacterium]
MEKPKKHILVCASFRPSGEPKGKCHRKGALDFLPYIENEIIDRGLDGVIVSSTCCLKMCDDGPVMVVYPDNLWYGNVDSEEAIDDILDAIEDGVVAEEYAL